MALSLLGMATSFALDAFGFSPLNRPRLPDIDARPGISQLQGQAAQAAVTVTAGPGQPFSPKLRVDRDALGRPQFIRAQAGFLTGPNGEGGMLSAKASAPFAPGDRDRGIKAFLQENKDLFGHGPEALTEARITREFTGTHNGLRSVTWQQQVDGIPVFEAVLMAHTTKRGELVNVSGQFLPDPVAAAEAGTPNRAGLMAAPAVTAVQSIRHAGNAIGLALKEDEVEPRAHQAAGSDGTQRFAAAGLSGDAHVSLVWLPVTATSLRLCWDVILTSRARGEMFRVLIDAETGKAWIRRCLTVYATDASYRVFTSDSPSPFSPGLSSPGNDQPPVVSRSFVTLTALSTNASPSGWINDGDNTTLGNNVDAHLDLNDDDMPDPGSRPTGAPFRVFDFVMDTGQAPSAYRPAAVVQLFYLNNWMHDKLYDLGFTEAAGNFQNVNFGRGGLEDDAILADAQDGAALGDDYHLNNANMSTPPDGMAPRMQMYVFDGPTPDRDGDFDAEIVLHEHTHGLSNRRVGGGVGISALQTGGMGEGWSDFYPLSLLSEAGDDPDACYASGGYACYQLYGLTQNYYFGIRRYPYSTDMGKNPLTFKDIDPAQADAHGGIPISPIFGGGSADEVHNMGEVWCVVLWEARANLVKKHGWAVGNELMLQLVTDAMTLCPANPNFLQGRDAIIQADAVDTGGANYRELWAAFAKRGMGYSATSPDSSTTEGLRESYDMPDDLQVTPAKGWEASGFWGGPFSPTSAVYTLMNRGDNPLSWKCATAAGWISLSATNGSLASGVSNTVRVSLNAAINGMAIGDYSAVVTFSNVTSGVGQALTIKLSIKAIPGKIVVSDTIDPATDTNLPFGDVALGYTRRERLLVTNSDTTYDLLISGIGFGYYREDFNDGLAQGWAPDNAAYWTVTNGEYQAQLKTGTRFMHSAYTGEKWADCNAKVTLWRTGYMYNSAVLAVRASDTFSAQASRGSAYMIGVTPAGYYYVGKYVNGTFSFLQNWSWSPLLTESANTVECNIRGNTIEVYFNGELAVSGTDDSIPGPGRVALLGYSETLTKTVHYFDDVTVGQWVSGGSLSGAQRWYNDHPCPSGDPTAMPADWTPPAYPGGESEPKTGRSGLTSKMSGPFRIDNLPQLPIRLAPGTGFAFDVAFQPSTTETVQNTVVIFSNDADTPELPVPVSGKGAINYLEVSPSSWLSVRGRAGGPFSPSGTVYTVTNGGGQSLSWAATNDSPWVHVAPLSGTLAASESATVTVTLDPAIAWLPEGVYSNPIVFHNLSLWAPRTRGVLLTVGRYPRLELTPLSFGVTNIVGSRTVRNLTVSNTGDSNLTWRLRLPNDIQQSDFENGAAGWTHLGMNDRWHISTNRAASGVSSWYCGDDSTHQYVNYINASLTSPSLLLRPGATLSFRHWYVTEPTFDNGFVEISTNGGFGYAALATFNGSNTEWATETFDLSAYAGKTAMIRFRFRSDAMGSAYEGWYVDDVQIAPVGVPSDNVVTANPSEGSLPPGSTTKVAVTFDSAGMNNGAMKTGEVAVISNDPHSPYTALPFCLRIVPPMTVAIPSHATEGDGLITGAGTLTLPNVREADLSINLVSSDPEEVRVPDIVTIPAGQISAPFDLTILDDRKMDGSRPVEIDALSDLYGSSVITVADNEGTNLTLVLPAPRFEGMVLTNGGRVILSGTWPSDLTVNLESSDSTEVTVPPQVTIPAGATSAVFTVTLPLDGISDGPQTGRVTASAAGFAPVSAPMIAQDRDIHHFAIGAVASPQKAGMPFLLTLTAKNIQGETVTAYRENVVLSASGNRGSVSLQPTNVPFIDGQWAGYAVANKPDLNVRITVGAGLPYAGRSNPFEVKLGAVDHFAWSAIPSPQNINYAFPVTLTAKDAANNTVTGFTGTVGLTGITGGWHATNMLSETGFVATNAGSRTAGIRFTPVRPMIVTHLRRFCGSKVSLWKDDGVLLASRQVVGANGVWIESELETPIQLQAGTTYRLAAYVPDSSGYAREGAFPIDFSDGTVIGGCVSASGDVFPNATGATGYLVDLRYASDVTDTVLMTPAKSGNFVKGVWKGSVTVKQGVDDMVLRAADSGGHVGVSRPFKTGALSLLLKVPPVVWEDGAVLAGAGTVTLSRAVSTNVFVSLVSSDSSELRVPARITVMAGKTSAAFSLTVVDDGIEDGPQAVELTASLSGYVPGAANLEVRPAVVTGPVMAPAGGKFEGTQTVTLACATPGAQIRFTADNTEVTESAALYEAPIELADSCILKARAFKPTSTPSATVTGSFTRVVTTIAAANEPMWNLSSEPDASRYFRIDVPEMATNLQFSISGGTGECDLIVRYGAIPETNAYHYYPALFGNNESVIVPIPQAGVWYAMLLGGPDGFMGVRFLVSYELIPPPADAPVITPAGGTKVGSILVNMTCSTEGATIRYTLNGTEPVSNSTVYTGPVTLNPAPLKTVKAKAFKTGRGDSATVTVVYKICTLVLPGKPVITSGKKGGTSYFAIKTPVGTKQLVFKLTAGTGNADLYVRKSRLPTLAAYDKKSVMAGNNELITITNPRANTWYYGMVKGKTAYQQAILFVTKQ